MEPFTMNVPAALWPASWVTIFRSEQEYGVMMERKRRVFVETPDGDRSIATGVGVWQDFNGRDWVALREVKSGTLIEDEEIAARRMVPAFRKVTGWLSNSDDVIANECLWLLRAASGEEIT